MAEIPFLVTVRVGAKVWNKYGLIGWGTVGYGLPQPMTVSAYVGDKYRINNPLWDGKEFTVLQSECTEYTAPPPTTDPPAAGDVPFTITIGDGVVYEKQVIEGVAKKL